MREVEWTRLRAPELRALASAAATVIVPVGSMEQHGPHLPVEVDSLLATEVSRRAARRVAEPARVVVAPTLWCGLAEHHMAFGATITLDFETFHAMLRCVCRSIARHGFPRVMLLNGHGGNVTALNVIAGELARELDADIATSTYWLLSAAASAFGEILEHQPNVRHACEAETSMLLAVAPDLVDREAMVTTDGPLTSVVSESGVYHYRSFAEISPSGVLGVPSAASAEKGERLLDAAADALADVLVDPASWR